MADPTRNCLSVLTVARQVCKLFDLDQTGFITREHLKQVANAYSPHDQGTGGISRDRLLRWFQQEGPDPMRLDEFLEGISLLTT